MRRSTLLLAIALQVLGCATPSNALIICISGDGCVELEPAAPGARRCAEAECDPGHATPDHDCRDIPVLADALSLKGASPTAGAAAQQPVLLAVRPAPVVRLRFAPFAADAIVRDRSAGLRSIVLQL